MFPAQYWETSRGKIHCYLCPHHCKIGSGERGRCGVRQNIDSQLYSLNYGIVTGIALDPIEKKPLYHYCPGSMVLSAGSLGCSLECGFCQNWSSVQGDGPAWHLSPAELAQLAVEYCQRGSCGIAFTYTEPLMWYEYVQDTADLARSNGLKAILVTNGFIEPEPWQNLLAKIDAVNIDLKAFTPGFYREHCRGRLKPVQEAIKAAMGKCHVEITTLLIEGHNTCIEEIRELSAFLADLDPDLPLHLSRYHPAHRWRQSATDPDLVRRLAEEAGHRLNHVYTGNLPDSWQAVTSCSNCGHILVIRGLETITDLAQGKCPRCGRKTNIRLCDKE